MPFRACAEGKLRGVSDARASDRGRLRQGDAGRDGQARDGEAPHRGG